MRKFIINAFFIFSQITNVVNLNMNYSVIGFELLTINTTQNNVTLNTTKLPIYILK